MNHADDLVGLVPEGWLEAFRSALVIDAETRTPDAEVFASQLASRSKNKSLFDNFEAYDVINDRYVVMPDTVGEGGIARVYRVNDVLHRREYAAKFIKPEAEGKIEPEAEFMLIHDLPPHPSIVRPELLQHASSVRRGESALECRGVFMLSPWIEGTRLDKLLESERIPRARAVEIALAVGEALVHLQEHHVVHRDVKPQNVIVDRHGVPRLVDFNVGRTIETAGETQVGTRGYKPPDLAGTGWGTDSDPYALSVTLAEMLAGRLLDQDANSWALSEPRLPDTLATVLQRGTAPNRSDRFADASELVDELRSALEELRHPSPFIAKAPFPGVPQDELSRPNWNPYQYRLLTLFSQSSESNKGTRGLDDFDRWAYVPTKVDRELYADIAAGRFKLVVITGNAGDGKTAFIQMLQQRLVEEGAELKVQPGGNGAIIAYEGRRLITNLDGSQDEGDRSNDDVLAAFFAPFAGVLPAPPDFETRVIAINEGRLIDFVTAQTDRFHALEKAVMGFVSETSYQLPEWFLLVNLNLRALTIAGHAEGEGNERTDSLTHEILKRFSDERLWLPCATCVAHDHCYARTNAATLRDPVLGPRAADRLRETLDLVRLRRRMHISMRDLRSALAYMVAGTRRCDEIVGLATSVDESIRSENPLGDKLGLDSARALLGGHLYNALFAASDKFGPALRDGAAAQDRLLRTTAAVDVAKTANPEDDGRLWRSDEMPFRVDPDSLVRTDRALIEHLRAVLPNDPHPVASSRAAIAFLQGTLRRKLYLEREDPTWIQMLPYVRLADFQRQLESTLDSDRRAIVRAISNSEGVFSGTFGDQLAVRLVTDFTGADRSYVSHSENAFRLSPLDRADAGRYVEYEPDSLRLAHIEHEYVTLDIDLDLFETLMRILDGHTPSREELRSTWLNLRVFKERIARIPADTLLLSRDDSSFHRVTRKGGELEVEAVS